jgi:hypothetical protein
MRAVFDLPYDPTTLTLKGADYNIVQNNGRCHRFRLSACPLDPRFQKPPYLESFLPAMAPRPLSSRSANHNLTQAPWQPK